jgi:hypothetical protein
LIPDAIKGSNGKVLPLAAGGGHALPPMRLGIGPILACHVPIPHRLPLDI